MNYDGLVGLASALAGTSCANYCIRNVSYKRAMPSLTRLHEAITTYSNEAKHLTLSEFCGGAYLAKDITRWYNVTFFV